MENGGSDNDKGGFRTTNTCQMGCFILHVMDARNAFKQRQWLLMLSFQLESFWEKKVHVCKVIHNKASNKVTLRVLVLSIIFQSLLVDE